jgi:hypothetical protein
MHLPPIELTVFANPVVLPAGRAMPPVSLLSDTSPPPTKTIGMVCVRSVLVEELDVYILDFVL